MFAIVHTEQKIGIAKQILEFVKLSATILSVGDKGRGVNLLWWN